MANQNGALIIKALEEIKDPATIVKIATHLANSTGVNPKDLRESIKETLDGGVRYGFIQKQNRKYTTANLDNIGQSDDAEVSSEDMEDRAGRRSRRRRSTSSSRRSASGQSRRRRRRRSRS